MTILCHIAIQRISGNRMAKMCGMHANLVRPPCLDLELHKRKAIVPAKDIPSRDSPFAFMFHHGHSLCIPRLAPNQRIKFPGRWLQSPVKNSKVGLLDSQMAFKIAPQRQIRAPSTGKHHDPARITVQAMHHARTLDASYSCHVREHLQQMVAKRAVCIARCPVDNHSGRLVHDNNIVIRVDHINVTATCQCLLQAPNIPASVPFK